MMRRFVAATLSLWLLLPAGALAQQPQIEDDKSKQFETKHGIFSPAEWTLIDAARWGANVNEAKTICSEKCKVCSTGVACDFECAATKCGGKKK